MKGRKERPNKVQVKRESTDISREILFYVRWLVRLKQSAFSRAYLHSFRFSPVCPALARHLANNKTTQITDYVAKGDFKQSNWLLPVVLCPVVLFTPITVTHNSACERDECSFMSVMAVALLVFPMANTCQSINRSIRQSINQSVNQSFNQSMNKSINQSINQSTNQSNNQHYIHTYIHKLYLSSDFIVAYNS